MSPQDKAPAYQWYVRDYMSDEAVALMSYEQQGIYRALLDRQWLEGSIPADPSQLAAILRIPTSRFVKLWPRVAVKFKPMADGRLANGRMEREREKAKEYKETKSKSGSKGAAARWQKDGSAIDSPQANDSSSSTSSTASTSASASASAVSFGQRRGAGAMGGSYLSQSTAAYTGARGVVIPPGKFYTEMLAKFDGDPLAFASWLDDVIARQPVGWKCGDVFRWVREQIDAQFNVKQGTAKTAGNVAALQAFVRGVTR